MYTRICIYTALSLYSLSPAAQDAALEEIIVTADPLSGVDGSLAQPVQVLSKEQLRDKSIRNIGETVSRELGVTSSDFGPAVGRPVIRGLSGNRVRVLENGIGTMDVSTVNADHAVSSEPVFADQIEIFRGPATLLYGSGASGGLINISSGRIPDEVPETLEGEASVQYDTGSNGITSAASLDAGAGTFAFHLEGMARDTGDYDIPGFAALDARGNGNEHGSPLEEGKLLNSDVKSDSLAMGAAFIGNRGMAGFSAAANVNNYGLSGHQHGESDHHHDERIDMEQTRYDFKGVLDEPLGWLQQARTRWGYSDYEHDVEVVGHGVSTRIHNTEAEGRVELIHKSAGAWNGVVGAQYRDRDFEVEGGGHGGGGATPSARQESIALFALEKAQFDDWHVDLGMRYEYQDAGTVLGQAQDHDAFSVSGGTQWDYRPGYQLGMSLTRAQRAPDLQEMFSTEPAHVATGTYIVSDPSLVVETSTNLDLSWHKVIERFGFTVNLFFNRINDYIFLQEQDLNGDSQPDRVPLGFGGNPTDILAPDEPGGLFLVHQTQADVELTGLELEGLMRLVEGMGVLDLRLWGDYVQGKRDDGAHLPRISPWRLGGGLAYVNGGWFASMDYTHVGRQDDTAPLETSTAGYNMLDVHAGYTFKALDLDLTVFAQGSNLLDKDARRHTSFLKVSAPLPGRSFTLGLRATF